MNHVWKFEDKQKKQSKLYGNLRILCESETIFINGEEKDENSVRYYIRINGGKKYEDENIKIVKQKVKRSKYNKNDANTN